MCFNCGKIGHFSIKCPYDKNSDSDEDKFPRKKRNIKRETRKNIKEKS